MVTDLKKEARVAIIWGYLGAVAKIFAQFVIQISLARLLGPELFGDAAIVMVVLALCWLLSDGGFGAVLIQKENITNEEVGFAITASACSSLIIAIILFAAAPWVASTLNRPELETLIILCSAIAPLQAFANIPISLMRRKLDSKRQQILQVSSYIIGMGCVSIPLAAIGYGAYSVLLGAATQSILILVGGILVIKPKPEWPKSWNKVMWMFGIQVLITNIANWSIENVDRIIISKIWGSIEVGGYSAMANLTRAPAGFMVNSLQSVAFSLTSRIQNDKNSIKTLLLQTISLVFVIICYIFSLLSLLSKEVVNVVYGAQWSGSAEYLAALAMTIPSLIINSLSGPVLWGTGRVRNEMIVQIVCGILLLVGFLWLKDLPLKKVVWVVPLVYFVRALWMTLAIKKSLEIPIGELFSSIRGGLILITMVYFVGLIGDYVGLVGVKYVVYAVTVSTMILFITLAMAPGILLNKDGVLLYKKSIARFVSLSIIRKIY